MNNFCKTTKAIPENLRLLQIILKPFFPFAFKNFDFKNRKFMPLNNMPSGKVLTRATIVHSTVHSCLVFFLFLFFLSIKKKFYPVWLLVGLIIYFVRILRGLISNISQKICKVFSESSGSEIAHSSLSKFRKSFNEILKFFQKFYKSFI